MLAKGACSIAATLIVGELTLELAESALELTVEAAYSSGGGGGGGMIVGGGGCDTDVRGNEKGAVKLGAEARCDDADGKRCGGIDACGCREVDCAGRPATASSLAVSITAEAFFLAPCFGGLSFPSSACRTVSKDSGVTLRVATAS